MTSWSVVVPTLGRPSLRRLLGALAADPGTGPEQIVLVDDRVNPTTVLDVDAAARLLGRVRVLRSGGRGPAAARNLGWRETRSPWVVFLDDDVEPLTGWSAALDVDLGAAGPSTAGVQGRVHVPQPRARRPTDWERQVAGLADAWWATADMAYRRTALEAVGGFDERFTRAYREDADLALRLEEAGWSLARGTRSVVHPVGRADPWISVRRQRGNADDPLMRALHGPRWRARAHAPPGRRPRHLAVTAALVTAAGAATRGQRVPALVAAAAWAAGTAELAWARIAPGPRSRSEVATMIATSAAIPPVASWWWLAGWVAVARGGARRDEPCARARPRPGRASAVLFDRDGTLVHDVPYNGDPDQVRPVAGARAAVASLRHAGVATAVVSNQSGVGRGLIDPAQVDAVNTRIDDEIGPLGPWLVCPHAPDDGCRCRKPAPGLVERAAASLGVDVADCVVIGDIGADMRAAAAAGARGVLVPTAVTRREEVAAAPVVASDLLDAVRMVLDGAA